MEMFLDHRQDGNFPVGGKYVEAYRPQMRFKKKCEHTTLLFELGFFLTKNNKYINKSWVYTQ